MRKKYASSPPVSRNPKEATKLAMWPTLQSPSILGRMKCLSTNNPAEALPAYENDENDYFVTARSDFFHSKPLQKKGPSTL
jgi:hypothetical protein